MHQPMLLKLKCSTLSLNNHVSLNAKIECKNNIDTGVIASMILKTLFHIEQLVLDMEINMILPKIYQNHRHPTIINLKIILLHRKKDFLLDKVEKP